MECTDKKTFDLEELATLARERYQGWLRSSGKVTSAFPAWVAAAEAVKEVVEKPLTESNRELLEALEAVAALDTAMLTTPAMMAVGRARAALAKAKGSNNG